MKKLLVCLLALLLLVVLFPIKMHLLDGGSVVYQSLIGIYRVTDWHQMLPISEGGAEKYKDGISVEIFGREIFNHTKNVPVA